MVNVGDKKERLQERENENPNTNARMEMVDSPA